MIQERNNYSYGTCFTISVKKQSKIFLKSHDVEGFFLPPLTKEVKLKGAPILNCLATTKPV